MARCGAGKYAKTPQKMCRQEVKMKEDDLMIKTGEGDKRGLHIHIMEVSSASGHVYSSIY
jgi:hypothetical protein